MNQLVLHCVLHLIVNMFKHANILILQQENTGICQFISLLNQCQSGVMVNSRISQRKLWSHDNLL